MVKHTEFNIILNVELENKGQDLLYDELEAFLTAKRWNWKQIEIINKEVA